ncbi:hypothetical protein EBS67_00360 [bacterium]|nr:hypothetical protein [bacterium]NBT60202.1 hypothetical protein [Planctomycetia bacterium]
MSKKTDIRLFDYPVNFPALHVGSVWVTTTRRHRGHRRIIVGLNSNKTKVRVKNVTNEVHQHREKTYTIDADIFAREHRSV